MNAKLATTAVRIRMRPDYLNVDGVPVVIEAKSAARDVAHESRWKLVPSWPSLSEVKK